MKKKLDNSQAAELRRQAEAKLSERKKKAAALPGTKLDTQRLVHELEVHQIELEMQNEELMQSRVQVEAGLRQYTDLYDFAPVGYFTLARDGTIHQVNLAGANLLGVERGALIKRRFGAFVSTESRSIFNDFLEKVFGSQLKGTCEVAFQKNGSTPLWVHIEATSSGISRGEGEACRVVVVDIAERKRGEEALRESKEKWRSLVNTMPDYISLLNIESKFEFLNHYAEGFAEKDVMGTSVYEYLDRNSHEIFRNKIEEALNTKKTQKFEHTAMGDNSHWRTYEDYLIPIIKKNRVINILVVSRDISERKRAEEALVEEQFRMNMLMDNVPDHIYFKDKESRFIRMNKSQAARFGMNDPAEAIGKTDFDFFTEQHAQPAFEDEKKIMKTGEPLIGVEEKETWPDGSVTWVTTTKMPLRDKVGEIIGTFGISKDITESKRAEEKNRQLEQRLIQAQKLESLGTLASGIAHDFNNILAIILAYSSLLEKMKMGSEKYSESLNAITNAVQRGAALVRQILTFARKTDILFEPMNLLDLVHEILSMLQQTFPKTIVFRENIEKDIPYIFADRTQIYQALLNLYLNARDAMPNGGCITLAIEKRTGEQIRGQFPAANQDLYLCVSVKDNGAGLDEATQSRIFDPFFTTKEKGKGTGLGLSVVFGVVQIHHGFIDVESEPGKGTTFLLYLPASQTVESIRVKEGKTIEEILGGTETLLVIEDEKALSELVRLLLETKGYKVHTAQDGNDAIEVYKQNKEEIDIVLTDMGLPGMAGTEVFKKLKEINPNVSVIFCSGSNEPNIKSELYKAGVKGFIQKPYNPNELLRKIREVLDEK